MQHSNVAVPNYLPMMPSGGGARPGGGMMGKGGGRPGGAPGMGGKGGGMRPPLPMGTRPDPFRGGPMGPSNPAGPPMRPPAMQDYLPLQVLPLPPNRGLVPPLNPMMPPPVPPQSPVLPPPPDNNRMLGLGMQDMLDAAAGQFTVAQSQPPRIMPGGGGRQSAPAPAPQPQPGLFNYLNLFSGG